MTNKIRKISVGPNPVGENGAMHFFIGQKVCAGKFTVKYILEKEDVYDIMIGEDDTSFLWKSVNKNMPIVIEYESL